MWLPCLMYVLFIWSILGTLSGYYLINMDCTAKTIAHVIGITPIEFDYCLAVFEYTTRWNNTLIGAAPVACSDLSDFEICYCQHYESHYSVDLESYFPNHVAEVFFYSGVWCSLLFVMTVLHYKMSSAGAGVAKEYLEI